MALSLHGLDGRTTCRVLLRRIDSWVNGAEVYLNHGARLTGKQGGSVRDLLIPEGLAIYREIETLWHGDSISAPLKEALTPVFRGNCYSLTDGPSGDSGLVAVEIALATIRSRLEEELLRSDAPKRALVDKAFLHLCRSLVVDAGVRQRWHDAYALGEAECERQGAVHLLQHGVYAFKAHASHARTDLILGTPLHLDEQMRAADVLLVLTEWKVANERDALDKAAVARRQVALYSGGALAGVELRSVRYIVVVTRTGVALPADERVGDVTYRFVNVPIAPMTPSVEARTAS